MRINHYLICISVIIILYFISLNPVLAGGSNEIPVDEDNINKSNSVTHFVIQDWGLLPHKNQRAYDDSWLDYVNDELDPIDIRPWHTAATQTAIVI